MQARQAKSINYLLILTPRAAILAQCYTINFLHELKMLTHFSMNIILLLFFCLIFFLKLDEKKKF